MPILTPQADRYKPHILLKQGRYGLVSLVLDLGDQRSRAARSFKQPAGDSELRLLEGLEREARVLRTIDHPNVARFDKVVEGEGGTWFFFWWIDGSPLGNYFGVESSVPSTWIVWWLNELLKGLSALHQHDPPVIIGYLDPADVIVQDERLCICDLGVLEDIFPEQVAMALSQHPFVNFIAPERRAASATQPSADLFSACAIAFWLSTGFAPNVTGPQDGPKHLAALKHYRPDMPVEVSELITAGLSYYPTARPSGADTMLAVLDPIVPDMRGHKAPPFPDVEVKYRAQTTRVFGSADVPKPISLESFHLPPPAAEETRVAEREPWWQSPAGRRNLVVAAVMLLIGIGLAVYSFQPTPIPAVQGWMEVASGPVQVENDHRAPGESRWKPTTRVGPGALMTVTDGEGTLILGDGGKLTLLAMAQVRNSGNEEQTLSLSIFTGMVRAETRTRALMLHLPASDLTVQPQSAVEVDLTGKNGSLGPALTCTRGQATLTVGGNSVTLEASSTAHLNSNGDQLLDIKRN